jgi:hypothetical protein
LFEDTKRGNQNPYIEEGQATQWPKEKVQKDKQRSTKHYTENSVVKIGQHQTHIKITYLINRSHMIVL